MARPVHTGGKTAGRTCSRRPPFGDQGRTYRHSSEPASWNDCAGMPGRFKQKASLVGLPLRVPLSPIILGEAATLSRMLAGIAIVGVSPMTTTCASSMSEHAGRYLGTSVGARQIIFFGFFSFFVCYLIVVYFPLLLSLSYTATGGSCLPVCLPSLSFAQRPLISFYVFIFSFFALNTSPRCLRCQSSSLVRAAEHIRCIMIAQALSRSH